MSVVIRYMSNEKINTKEKSEKSTMNNSIQKNQYRYMWVFIPFFLAYLGNLFGGIATLFGIGFLGILTVLDCFWKSDKKTEVKDSRKVSNQILFCVAAFQLILSFSFLWGVTYGNVVGIWVWSAILSNGIAIGIAASAGAHELIHRRSKLEKTIGTLQVAAVLYGHHTVEHIQGHHRNVATDIDPSSPDKGTWFWKYLVVGYFTEIKEGYTYEATRLKKKSKNPFSLQNQVVKYWSFTFLWLFGIFVFFRPAFLGYIIICLIFIVFHAAVVYAQHYGLRRQEGERVNDTLSWQTNTVITEYFLLGFGNHSDHHTRVTKTYTEITNKPDGPNSVCGYFASFWLVIIPPIWFSIYDKKIANANPSTN